MKLDLQQQLARRAGRNRKHAPALGLVVLAVIVGLSFCLTPESHEQAGLLASLEGSPLFWAAFGLAATVLMAVILKKIILPIILIKDREDRT